MIIIYGETKESVITKEIIEKIDELINEKE